MNPFRQVKPTSAPSAQPVEALRASCGRGRRGRRRGQALLEFAMIFVIMAILVMGLADYGRLCVMRQAMASISRDGANLVARGSTLSDAASAMVTGAPSLVFSNGYGRIIVSTVTRSSNGVVTITSQFALGDTNFVSRVGVAGATGSGVTLPSDQLPPTNQTLFVTEVFYPFSPATPVGNLLSASKGTNFAMPTSLYDVTFF